MFSYLAYVQRIQECVFWDKNNACGRTLWRNKAYYVQKHKKTVFSYLGHVPQERACGRTPWRNKADIKKKHKRTVFSYLGHVPQIQERVFCEKTLAAWHLGGTKLIKIKHKNAVVSYLGHVPQIQERVGKNCGRTSWRNKAYKTFPLIATNMLLITENRCKFMWNSS